MLRLIIIIMAALSLFACDGSLNMERATDDVGADARWEADVVSGVDARNPEADIHGSNDARTERDEGGAADTNVPEGDAGDDCEQITCGQNAECAGGQCLCRDGFEGDPAQGCTAPGPCDGVDCANGATCIEGTCHCDGGFDDDGQGGCTPLSPGDTALRTRDEVCGKWNADWPIRATTLWTQEPADQCDWGELHPEVHVDALRRTSLYRWLVGLGPVTSSEPHRVTTQACATTLAARSGGLTHTITADFPCYTDEAKAGAASSNLARGIGRPAGTVDLYIGDVGVPSLGHRRWIFNPAMGVTAFGQRDAYSCMYSFGRGSSDNPDYVAYPAPGFFPRQGLIGTWSFSSSRYGFGAQTDVEITRVGDGASVPVSNVYIPGGGYGQPVLGWTVNAQDQPLDTELEVRITGLSGNLGDTVVYRVTITNC
ncbi:MAG: hypothetical protein ACNA8W_04340 [Bradymonadaceae bacterium]